MFISFILIQKLSVFNITPTETVAGQHTFKKLNRENASFKSWHWVKWEQHAICIVSQNLLKILSYNF